MVERLDGGIEELVCLVQCLFGGGEGFVGICTFWARVDFPVCTVHGDVYPFFIQFTIQYVNLFLFIA